MTKQSVVLDGIRLLHPFGVRNDDEGKFGVRNDAKLIIVIASELRESGDLWSIMAEKIALVALLPRNDGNGVKCGRPVANGQIHQE